MGTTRGKGRVVQGALITKADISCFIPRVSIPLDTQVFSSVVCSEDFVVLVTYLICTVRNPKKIF